MCLHVCLCIVYSCMNPFFLPSAWSIAPYVKIKRNIYLIRHLSEAEERTKKKKNQQTMAKFISLLVRVLVVGNQAKIY
jgi:hypothetical protein